MTKNTSYLVVVNGMLIFLFFQPQDDTPRTHERNDNTGKVSIMYET